MPGRTVMELEEAEKFGAEASMRYSPGASAIPMLASVAIKWPVHSKGRLIAS